MDWKFRPAAKRGHTTISIPKPLFEKLEEARKKTGFGSVSAFVTYILRESLVMEDANWKAKLSALGYKVS